MAYRRCGILSSYEFQREISKKVGPFSGRYSVHEAARIPSKYLYPFSWGYHKREHGMVGVHEYIRDIVTLYETVLHAVVDRYHEMGIIPDKVYMPEYLRSYVNHKNMVGSSDIEYNVGALGKLLTNMYTFCVFNDWYDTDNNFAERASENENFRECLDKARKYSKKPDGDMLKQWQ